MTVALTAKSKLDLVDDSLEKPPPMDPMVNVWFRCHSMFLSWILNAVSKEPCLHGHLLKLSGRIHMRGSIKVMVHESSRLSINSTICKKDRLM